MRAFPGDDDTLIKGDSSRVPLDNRETFDLMVIDDNHAYDATKIDFELSERLPAKGGMIAMHNASALGHSDFECCKWDGRPCQVATELRPGNELKVAAKLIEIGRAHV